MIPFSYNNDDNDIDINIGDDIDDIIDNIYLSQSSTSSLVFTIDMEQPYEHFHMITDKVAIGDYTTSYDNFDVIFNFNYPYNGATLGVIDTELDYDCGAIQQTLYKIGLLDTTIYSDMLMEIFIKLIPFLIESKGKRILFHCYAGISRSTTAAILYFILTTDMSLDEIYRLITSKRSHVNPNPTFRRIIEICYSMRSQIK
jgi:protein-tyrosine phosphatase